MSGTFPLGGINGAPGRSGEKHAVVDHAENFDHSVHRHPVDKQVSRFRDTVLSGHKPTHGA